MIPLYQSYKIIIFMSYFVSLFCYHLKVSTTSWSNITEEPIHIINISLMNPVLANEPDEILSSQLETFVKAHKNVFDDRGIRRVTFLIHSASHSYPRYFTYRARHQVNYIGTVINSTFVEMGKWL